MCLTFFHTPRFPRYHLSPVLFVAFVLLFGLARVSRRRHLARLCTVVPSVFVSRARIFALSTRRGGTSFTPRFSELGTDRRNEFQCRHILESLDRLQSSRNSLKSRITKNGSLDIKSYKYYLYLKIF